MVKGIGNKVRDAIYLQLQWFDTVENVKVSSILTSKRWTTEITSRDALYLEKLGVKLTT